MPRIPKQIRKIPERDPYIPDWINLSPMKTTKSKWVVLVRIDVQGYDRPLYASRPALEQHIRHPDKAFETWSVAGVDSEFINVLPPTPHSPGLFLYGNKFMMASTEVEKFVRDAAENQWSVVGGVTDYQRRVK